MDTRLTEIVMLLLMPFALVAQNMVFLEHSKTLSFDEQRLKNAQILRGDVRFRHDSALMYCDSAYFYDKENALDAFGHVRLVQGDTLLGFADKMYYDGNRKLVRFRENVQLIHRNTTLTTDSLNYDRNAELAYYFTHGEIHDSLNQLTSVYGQYNTRTSRAFFRDSVQLANAKFIMKSDTLNYNSKTHVADIVSPTEIVYENETNIYSSSGWYNTDSEHSMLLNRSLIAHNDGKTLVGDTIFYDKPQGYGQVFGRMEMTDSLKYITLYGNYGEVWQNGNRGYATDSALMVEWSDSSHFTYLHADTLYSEEVLWTYQDSVCRIDTTFQQIRAFHGVRMFREDMQAVCDSMVYHSNDSILILYADPICWSENNQMSSDSIYIYLRNGTVDYMHGMGHALAVKEEDDSLYDQMAGKEMKAYVKDGTISRVDVSGNAETIYYPQEESEIGAEYVGLNRTQSSYVKMFFIDGKIHHVLFTTETTGTIYPMDQIPLEQATLSGYFWAEEVRPLLPGDVFVRTKRAPRTANVGKSTVHASPNMREQHPRKRVINRNLLQ